MKRTLYTIFLLFLLIALPGCTSSHNANMRLAEERAVNWITGLTFSPHTVERTIYDEETGTITVYVKPLTGDGPIRGVIFEVTENGELARVNYNIEDFLD